MPIHTLNHLERIEVRSPQTQNYIQRRAVEVQQWINKLTAFAELKPSGKPGLYCAWTAKQLQSRLDRVMKRQKEKT